MKRFTFGTLAVVVGIALIATWAMLPANAQNDDDVEKDNPARGGRGKLGIGGGGGFGFRDGFGGGGIPAGFENIPLVQSANLAVIVSEKHDRASAYNPRLGEWQIQSLEGEQGAPEFFPVPILGQNLAVIMTPESLYAYSAIVGKWHEQSLKGVGLQPGIGGPTVSADMASFSVPGRVFAYSAFSGRWSELKLPVGKESPVAHQGNHLSVVQGDIISMFSAKTGTWTSINWKLGKKVYWKDDEAAE